MHEIAAKKGDFTLLSLVMRAAVPPARGISSYPLLGLRRASQGRARSGV